MFVLTIKTDDGITTHVQCATLSEAYKLLAVIEREWGPLEPERARIDEKAPGWECDGSDGCLVDA